MATRLDGRVLALADRLPILHSNMAELRKLRVEVVEGAELLVRSAKLVLPNILIRKLLAALVQRWTLR